MSNISVNLNEYPRFSSSKYLFVKYPYMSAYLGQLSNLKRLIELLIIGSYGSTDITVRQCSVDTGIAVYGNVRIADLHFLHMPRPDK